MIEFRMPSLGADMDSGTVLEWRVKPGDRVKRGDVIALVDTDKAEIEVEIWEGGVVEAIAVLPGAKVPVGTVLATLRGEAEAAVRAAPAAPGPPPVPAAIEVRVAAPILPPTGAASARRIHASPLARRLASEAGLELESLSGSGPGGAITRADVERAAAARGGAAEAAPAAAQPPAESERERAMRRAIAAAMARSKREIPHYYLESEIDFSQASRWLEAENARRPISERLLYSVLLLKAVALAVREVPELNGHWIDGSLRRAERVHLGVAISLRGGGLLAPAIHDVDRKGVSEIMRELRDLVGRARRARLRSSEISDATLTVTSLGELGVEKVFGVIYPPQVALVGFGRVSERPFAEHGLLGVRPLLTATLSGDHRASDGARGARFLTALARLLAQPEKL